MGSDINDLIAKDRLGKFQSTLPHGERPYDGYRMALRACFNPRSHMGSDMVQPASASLCSCFNPRSHMGSDLDFSCMMYVGQGFNPRSHMGSDIKECPCFDAINVSIHAPTWGATPNIKAFETEPVVSIHAPTWGATDTDENHTKGQCVSIHAPTWGATYYTAQAVGNVLFQSTLPHGERPEHRTSIEPNQSFNPRSHMGSDH